MDVMMGLSGIRSRNQVYELLKKQILCMELQPRDMLSENTLSAQMKAGRPLVREALVQLVEEGYVVVYPQKGTEVSLIDPERVKQAVHAHIVLEQAIVKELCSQGLTEGQMGQLDEVLKLQKEKSGRDAVLELLILEREFHYLLSAFCGREHIWKLFRTLECDALRVSYLRYGIFNYQVRESALTSWENTQVEERLLLENIRRGEGEAAVLLCANHFNGLLWHMDALKGIYPQYFA